MTPKNLEDLYVHELRDLYSAEMQLEEALPKLIKLAHHPELQHAFEHHLNQTQQQRKRLEQIFGDRGMSPTGVTCHAMKGLIKEADNFASDAKNLFGKNAPASVVDAGLISHAQRVEHYEIAAYGTVCTYAEMLGQKGDFSLLSTTLDEEKSTDARLNEIAKELVNPEAMAPAE